MKTARDYPWDTLPSLSRDDVQARQSLLRWAHQHVDLGRVSYVCSRVLKTPIEVTPIYDGHRPRELLPALPEVQLRCGDVAVVLGLEAGLAAKIAGAVLGHPVTWVDPDWVPDDTVRGAVTAFLLVVLRRVTSTSLPWKVSTRSSTQQPPKPKDAQAELGLGGFWMRVLVGDEAFLICVHASLPYNPARFGQSELASMGLLPLSLPLVAASLILPRRQLASVIAGDVVALWRHLDTALRFQEYFRPCAAGCTGR
ncbi:MAG: hypothetical protein U0165_19095 [Polyangiaceae bacterium]